MTASLPETMQAVQIDEAGGPLVVRDLPVPRPGPGQVLVRMAAAPINPSDLAFLRGTYAVKKPYPTIPGLEGSGTVVAAGPGLLPRLWQGRRVACAAAPTAGGTWAQYMVTWATLCAPLRKGISLEEGAMLLVNPMTALAFLDIIRQGKHAAAVNTAAASALGRMLLRLGLHYSIPIIHVVRRQEQVHLLRSLGAQHVLDSSHPDFFPNLRDLARRLKATLLLDAIAGDLTRQLLQAAPPRSTVMLYGNLSMKPISVEASDLYTEDKRLAGFYLASWMAQKNTLRALWDTHRVQRLADVAFGSIVQSRLPLAAAQTAVDLYRQHMTAGKVLLLPDHP